jgi:hypothetical protein
MTGVSGLRGDRWLIAALLFAAGSEIAMREVYHQLGTELSNASILCCAALGLTVASVWGSRIQSPGWRRGLSRTLVLAALAVLFYLVAWPTVAAHMAAVGPWMAPVAAVIVLVGMLRLPESSWARIRPVMAIAGLIFVWSQPLVAKMTAPELDWPVPAPGVSGEPSGGRPPATLVLLFDELNAREAPAFEAELARHGLAFESKRLTAVDKNTSEAVPGMFTGARFHDAKACSTSATCAGGRVLDFARVQATRPDIDVVGFFHPYCDIRGLRWCRRGTMHYHLSELDRWRCALWRRTGWSGSLAPQTCADVHGRVWESVREQVLGATREAPTLRAGGVLFAHIPLPHPPGRPGSRTLRADYEDNIARATALLGELIADIDRAGLSPRVVLFSDHPLRQANWCQNFVQYAATGCVLDSHLDDADVPIVVAARPDVRLPSLAAVTSNAQVFSVVGDWPQR